MNASREHGASLPLRNVSSYLRPSSEEILCRDRLGWIDEDDGFEGLRFRRPVHEAFGVAGVRCLKHITTRVAALFDASAVNVLGR